MGKSRVRKYPRSWRQGQFRKATHDYKAIFQLFHAIKERFGWVVAMETVKHYIDQNWMDIPTHYVEAPEPGDLEYVYRN